MGIGKTTVCEKLYQEIDRCVWLDGDWCWMMHPWNFSENNKKMVLNNISYILNNYLNNGYFKVVLFDWVLHQNTIYEKVLSRIKKPYEFELFKISLISNERALSERLLQAGVDKTKLDNSIGRLPLYYDLDTLKIDTSDLTADEVVCHIKNICSLN